MELTQNTYLLSLSVVFRQRLPYHTYLSSFEKREREIRSWEHIPHDYNKGSEYSPHFLKVCTDMMYSIDLDSTSLSNIKTSSILSSRFGADLRANMGADNMKRQKQNWLRLSEIQNSSRKYLQIDSDLRYLFLPILIWSRFGGGHGENTQITRPSQLLLHTTHQTSRHNHNHGQLKSTAASPPITTALH